MHGMCYKCRVSFCEHDMLALHNLLETSASGAVVRDMGEREVYSGWLAVPVSCCDVNEQGCGLYRRHQGMYVWCLLGFMLRSHPACAGLSASASGDLVLPQQGEHEENP